MGTEDAHIVAECQRGHLEKFELLYDAYVKKIYHFIYYKIYHRETAEDLTSTVFLRALQHLKNFDPDRGSFQAWLYQIARNAVIDHFRTQRPNVNIEDVWDLHDEQDITYDLDARETLTRVRQYLKTLKPEQRELVLLRLWDNLPFHEIAQIQGKTETSCRMSFSRIITRLRKDMPLGLFLAFILLRLP